MQAEDDISDAASGSERIKPIRLQGIPRVMQDQRDYTISCDSSCEKLQALRWLANRSVKTLQDENPDLIIYPQKLRKGWAGSTGKQTMFSLAERPKTGSGQSILNLHTFNLAGFISCGEHNLTITSRFCKVSYDEDEGGKQMQEDFLLRYLLSRNSDFLNTSLLHDSRDSNLIDLRLLMFPLFLNKALAQGVFRTFVRRQHNDMRFKGSVNVEEHLRRNIPFEGRICYQNSELSYENDITLLIRLTAHVIKWTPEGQALLQSNLQFRKELAVIAEHTPGFSVYDRASIIKNCLQPVRHPFFTAYEPLRRLCLQILFHHGLHYVQDSSDRVSGILFDLAALWEEYLAAILTTEPLDFKHPNNREQDDILYLGRFKKYERYPDFYHEDAGIVLDAKYKRKIDTRDDINQIITYMYRLKAHTGMFVLPAAYTESTVKLLGIGEDTKPQSQVIVKSFGLPESFASYEECLQIMQNREQRLEDFVKSLAITECKQLKT